MGTEQQAIRLLILDDSQNNAEHLVSVLRNAGHATRAHRVSSVEDLQESLQQSWDLCLALPKTSFMQASDACNLIRQTRDIPIILLLEQADTDASTQALRQGMQDAVPLSAEKLLTLVVQRELSSLQARRQARIAEQTLKEVEKRCQLLLDSSVDAIAYVHDGMHIYANRAYVRLFGYDDPDDLAAEPMVGLIATKDQSGFKSFLRHYQERADQNELRCNAKDIDGKEFPVMLTLSPANYDGEPCTQVVIRVETASADFEEKLKAMASQDLVTGLFNRSHFQEELERISEQVVREGNPSTLVYLTIDAFNGLQTELGIGGADLVLADLAQILRQSFAEGTLMARFGDDALSVLVQNQEPEGLQDTLQALLRQVEANLFEAAGRSVQVTLSVGVASLNENDHDPSLIINRVLRLAEQVSRGGGNNIKIFNPLEELAHEANRGNLIALVQHSLETNGFQLQFQPVVSLQGDNGELYEAYLRLLNAQGEEVPAAEFLPTAQEAGMADDIDRWVVTEAINQLCQKRTTGGQTRLLINLSAASLQNMEMPQWIAEQLKSKRLPSDAVIFQFNDADANTYMKQAKALTEALKSIHCQVSLSHFGCALNPFAALKHLQVDMVKVDNSFSQNLSTPEAVNKLKELIMTLHNQGKLTVVPCVDSATMLPSLWQTGVNYIQGNYLQAPSDSMNYDFTAE
ncbi:EAL domain-containing protein [Halopseudomonas salegens]|uniref:Response regulator receiver modulated diguanylate cyclase/phosphodiesterase n=1 Tax=Halopseudomonas salegens TaxID=1434072 RepID=A0A1H2G0J3_9GAMM|nr:EAL domain-containing protein [Halopseudomonas salegens]SDU13109.1 response regulator receiver modulated diguanylate cyclase/phosphodiesterase [Halopseudomonas salegens]